MGIVFSSLERTRSEFNSQVNMKVLIALAVLVAVIAVTEGAPGSLIERLKSRSEKQLTNRHYGGWAKSGEAHKIVKREPPSEPEPEPEPEAESEPEPEPEVEDELDELEDEPIENVNILIEQRVAKPC